MRYSFGPYILDTACQELHRAGEPVKLRRKVFQVLVYLLAHRERVVPQQELLEHLWPDQFVGDEALKSCMKTLRQALGDSGRTPRFIRTLHGHGYRFVAAVEEREPLAAHDASLVALPAVGTLPSLAPGGGEGALHPSPMAHALDGEHKQVTVLCGALAEAPTLAALLEPEAMYHLMRDVLALAQDIVQRYGGTLLQVSGEGFVALFGAPVAQEDHARRAVLAALELRQRLHTPDAFRGKPPGVTVRLGLHSGPVVVGSLGHDPQRPYTAGGDTLALATRLQQQATPDTVLVSTATYGLVQAEVEGEVWVSDSSIAALTPAAGYVVHGRRRRRGGVPWRGGRPRSPLVGRTRELALLHARLALAVRGQGQVVGIAGEAGMGKSRLLAEFAQSLHGQPVTYCEGHCLAYASTTPYGPVRDLLRQLWSLPDTIAPDALMATIAQRLHAAGIASEADRALLLQFLDVEGETAALAGLSPEARRVRIFALLRQLVRHASQGQPLVLAVENLHWSDPTSAEWLEALAAQAGGAAILLLATYRPGTRLPWLAHSWATQVALPPLHAPDSLAVVQAAPGAAQLSGHQEQAIVARAAGNPFFLEELTWAAVESGDPTRTQPLPDTVKAVLAARLGQLPPETKRLVQIAAVIGHEVHAPLLQQLAGLAEETLHSGLAHLQDVELLYETQSVPEPVYTFKHVLTHDVAYSSLLQGQRRAIHACIVETLEALVGDQVAERVERLVHHALRGEVWDKAIRYCQQAGTMAFDRAAFREAVASFEQALQALTHLPESRDTVVLAIEIRLALRTSLAPLGEHGRGLALLGEAEAQARTLDDRTWLAQVLTRMSQAHRMAGDLDGAIAASQHALALTAQLGNSALQVQASHYLGAIYYDVGDFVRAAELQQWTVEAADQAAGTFPTNIPSTTTMRSQSRARLARTLGALGAFAEGRRHGEEALRLAMLDGRGQTPVIAHACLGELYLAQGDLEHAIRVLEPGLALCRASDDQTYLRGITTSLSAAYTLQGRQAEGQALLEEVSMEESRRDARFHHARGATGLSEAYRLVGRGAEAGQYARQGLDLARQQKARGDEAHALYQLGVIQAHADPPDVKQAESYYQKALTLADALGMRPLQAHCHQGLGTLYAQTGRRAQARVALTTAIDLYRAMEMTFWLPQAETTLAHVED